MQYLEVWSAAAVLVLVAVFAVNVYQRFRRLERRVAALEQRGHGRASGDA